MTRPLSKITHSLLLCISVAVLHSGYASDDLAVEVTNGQFNVVLPDSSTSNQLRMIEWSTNLVDWVPVGRDYGTDWENTFPYALPITNGGINQVLSDPSDAPARYYRVVSATTSSLNNSNSISRFLQQATFGPTRDLINNFPGLDSADLNDAPYTNYEAWIDAQIAGPTNSHRAFWRERSDPSFTNNPANAHLYEVGHNPSNGTQLTYYIAGTAYKPDELLASNPNTSKGNDVTFSNNHTKKIVWYQMALKADDDLRQKTAWALSQIFVVGEDGSNQESYTERWLTYYDIFVRHAFGNFRDILGEVTFSPHMGYYLTFDQNTSFAYDGKYPDENYAREVMQLFTIGLWELNQDGTFVRDSNGELIPTYGNTNITEFSEVFTGLRKELDRDNVEPKNNNFIDPAKRVVVNYHDFSAKTLLDGSTLGPFTADADGLIADIDGLLNHLFEHPNTPPFIARKLIQRFTVSNPSPQYIYDVAGAFINNGSGVRGDLGAVVKAILLHPEAREPALAYDSAHGRLREPLIRLMSYGRAFEITSPQTYGFFPFYQMGEYISQSPYDYPSVFNFYRQDYQPLGEILDRNLDAPEFQIHDDITALRLPNAIHWLVYEGIQRDVEVGIGQRWYSQGDLDLTFEKTLATDTDALLDHLDKMVTAGRLTSANRTSIRSVIDLLPSGSDSEKTALVQRALWLMALTPEFNVLY